MSKAQENKDAINAPIFDFNNEQLLNILLFQTEQALAEYEEIKPNDKEFIILEQRREYLIEQLRENGYSVPSEKKTSRRAA